MDRFRVFISAVTSEFGSARDALANDLQSHDNLIVRVQRSFRYEDDAETLLHKLRNYIETCDVMIFLIGARSGTGFPTAIEAEPFRGDHPQEITEASYTQWEMFFARRLGKKCLIYLVADEFERDQHGAPPGDCPHLQTNFIAHVSGPQRTSVRSRDEFRAEVLKDLLHSPLPPGVSARIAENLAPKPIDLHYPSIGTLLKGRKTFLDRLHASLTRPDGGTAAIAGKAVHGMGGVGKPEPPWNMPGRTATTTPPCSSWTPRPRTNCTPPSRPWRPRFACPPPRHLRKPCGSKPCWTGSTPIPPGC
jgi:hypothetical protein